MRKLSKDFLDALQNGKLAPLVDAVSHDSTLCMEFRGHYINVYYRGGNLMKVKERKASKAYSISFDTNYFNVGGSVILPNEYRPLSKADQGEDDIVNWITAIPALKSSMDRKFARHRKYEREFQQLILRENNFKPVARQSDYYICDIEFQNAHGRFDMIAVEWPSNGHTRKMAHDRRLVIVEVKYGDKALDGSAGLRKHIEDVNAFVGDAQALEAFKEDMVCVFNQKRSLGLIDCVKNLESFSDEPPLLVLALVNHDPDSSKLSNLFDDEIASPHVELRIATATFLGYGLYHQGIHSLEDAKKRFAEYIHTSLR